jgi:hypothetical protein
MKSRSAEIGAADAAFAVVAMDAVCAVRAQDAEERQINASLINAAITEV